MGVGVIRGIVVGMRGGLRGGLFTKRLYIS